MSTAKQKNLAQIALILAVFVWASAFVGIRFTIGEYSPGPLALFRYLIASLIMLPLFYYFKQPGRQTLHHIFYAMFLGVIGFAIYGVFLNYGEQTVSAGLASFIIGLNPIFVALFACWIYHEKINRLMQVGFCISLVGLCFILAGAKGVAFGRDFFYVMIASMAAGIYALLQKRSLIRMNAVEFTSYAIWGGTLSMLLYLPELGTEIMRASLLKTSVVIYMGIVPSAMGYFFWSYGFKHLPASQAISYLYWQPFCCIAMAFLFLHEIPAMISLTGGCLALIGAMVVNKYNIKN
jgi:drug/metabolite transporter (DMT)-like permease